jgi:hypothetical protein
MIHDSIVMLLHRKQGFIQFSNAFIHMKIEWDVIFIITKNIQRETANVSVKQNALSIT